MVYFLLVLDPGEYPVCLLSLLIPTIRKYQLQLYSMESGENFIRFQNDSSKNMMIDVFFSLLS